MQDGPPARTLGTLALAAMLAACVDGDRGRDRDDGNVFGGGLGGLLGQRVSHREVLGLIVLHELTYDEAARVCGCEVGTVKSRMSRARAVLKETFLNQAGLGRKAPTEGGRPLAVAVVSPAFGIEGRVRAVLDKHGSTRHELSSGTFAHCEPRPSRHLVPHLDLERTIT